MPVLEKAPEVNHNSTRRGKTPRAKHTVDDGFRITIKEITRGFDPKLVGKPRRTGYSNVAFQIKRHAMAWADGFPRKFGPPRARVPSGFTPAVRDVFKRIVWSQNMGTGYAAFSHDTLGAPTKTVPGEYHRDTVRVAVGWLRDHGLIQYKTGRGWGREDRRILANQYAPNFWMFIDPETGLFLDPPYLPGPYEWRDRAAQYRHRLINGVQAEMPPSVIRVSTGSRGIHNGNGVQAENPPLYSYTGAGCATAAPVSAGATPGSATATPQENSDDDYYDDLEEYFVWLNDLAIHIGIEPGELLAFLSGLDFGEHDVTGRLIDLCDQVTKQNRNSSSNAREYNPIFDGDAFEAERFGRIVVDAEKASVFYEANKPVHISIDDLKVNDCLLIEYRLA